MIVQRKYFNQITSVWMAVRRIEVQYRHYLKGYVRDRKPRDLTKYINTTCGIKMLNLNKLNNRVLNLSGNCTLFFDSTDKKQTTFSIPIFSCILRRVHIMAHGDKIGKLTIAFGSQKIIDKIIDEKTKCLYLNAYLPSNMIKTIKAEFPIVIASLYCDISFTTDINNILFKYCGNFQTMNGIALPHHQYLE